MSTKIPPMPQTYFRCILLCCCLLSFAESVRGQNVRISQGGRVDLCSGTLFDSGGANDPHTSNGGPVRTITICSNDPPVNTHIRLAFSDLTILGTLDIFDGPDVNAPRIFSGTDESGLSFISAATLANSTGCLTVRFTSTGSAPGWAAGISCSRACQPIQAVVLSTSPAAMPDLNGYIDVCPGDEVTITARGEYSQNGVGYNQNDATSLFTWNFQDGDPVSGIGLTTVSHVYDDPGGYVVQLTITDQRTCTNNNQITQRVRVAPPPIFNAPANLPMEVCVGDVVNLTLGTPGSGGVNFNPPTPREITFTTTQARTDIIPLPDVRGVIYTTPLTFSNFNPGQVVTSLNDIVSVCATIGHDWLNDLDIFLVCPSGTDTVFFQRHPRPGEGPNGTSGQTLGAGVRFNGNVQDPPGTYCWTVDAPRSMARHIRDFNIPSGDQVPEIDYAALPEYPFDNIIGCPLNGTWTLNFEDWLGDDSGWSYDWSITFADELYPDIETFSVAVDDSRFENASNISVYTPNDIVFQSFNPGPNKIRIVSTDDFGCRYDTAIVFDVLPSYLPECATCGPLVDRNSLDTTICAGESFTPDVAVNIANDTIITFESYAGDPFGASLYPDQTNAYLNTVNVLGFSPATITDVAAQLESVCVNLENDGNLSDVTIELIAPNGRVLTLVRNVGGNGEDLTQTCFTPTAVNPLGSGTAPYTGTFAPSGGNWTGFNTSASNGQWQLRAFDRAGNDLGRLLSWSLSLSYDRSNTYAWTPVDGNLSCTDCPNPVITANGPATYTLNVTNPAGCTDQSTVVIGLNTLDITVNEVLRNPSCPATSTGAIDLTVTGSDPTYFYEWNDGSTTQDRTGVPAGNYTVSITDANGCFDVFSYELTERPPLVVTLDEVIDVNCFGGSTGEIRVSTSGGTPPYVFLWDDPNAQNGEDAGALTRGTYTLRVTDAVGCTANLTESVDEPAALTIGFTSTPVTCRDGDDGTATALPAGGNGDYRFAWQTGATTATVNGLAAGVYEVTVTDPRGCTATNAVTINQPAAPLTATVGQDARGCFGAAANRATVTPSGGTPVYAFLWSNGETTATATALPAGENMVTVTDGNGCTTTATLLTNDLEEIVVTLQLRLPTCNDRSDGRVASAFNVRSGTVESDYTFLWSNGSTEPTIVNVPGNLTYSVTVTGPDGCTGVGQRFLPAPPPITFNVNQTPVSCTGGTNGGLTISNVNGPNGGPFTFQWGPAAGNSTNPSVAGLPAGDYRLTISGPVGCIADTILTIREPPPLTAGIARVNVSCFGETDGRITATGVGGVGGYRYAWVTGSNQNQIASLAAGTYTLTVTDANNCTAVLSVPITQPDPVGLTVAPESVLCEGDATGRVTITGTGGRPPFLYGLNGQGVTRNPVFIGLRAGVYEAMVRDSSGCGASTFVTIEDGPSFSVTLPEDTTLIFGDSLLILPELVGGVDTLRYNWFGSYGGTLDCEDCPTALAKPEYEIDYELLVIDGDGCTAEDQMRVSVRKIREVAVPTGFTPNGDNRNDILIVHGRPGTQVVNFVVFDRWANVLYEANDFEVNDASRGWDGTVNDQPANGGVYLYKIVVRYDDDSEEVLSGETTLIR